MLTKIEAVVKDNKYFVSFLITPIKYMILKCSLLYIDALYWGPYVI